MSDKVFIDTNVLLYAYDRDSGAKHETARELIRRCWEDTSGVISIQVLSEFFVRATRAGSSFVSPDEAEAIIQNLSHTWTIVIPDVPVVLEAIRGRKVHQLSYWDALIWATAKQAKIDTIYTEDFQHGQVGRSGRAARNPTSFYSICQIGINTSVIAKANQKGESRLFMLFRCSNKK